jgi:hypothetical protein
MHSASVEILEHGSPGILAVGVGREQNQVIDVDGVAEPVKLQVGVGADLITSEKQWDVSMHKVLVHGLRNETRVRPTHRKSEQARVKRDVSKLSNECSAKGACADPRHGLERHQPRRDEDAVVEIAQVGFGDKHGFVAGCSHVRQITGVRKANNLGKSHRVVLRNSVQNEAELVSLGDEENTIHDFHARGGPKVNHSSSEESSHKRNVFDQRAAHGDVLGGPLLRGQDDARRRRITKASGGR